MKTLEYEDAYVRFEAIPEHEPLGSDEHETYEGSVTIHGNGYVQLHDFEDSPLISPARIYDIIPE